MTSGNARLESVVVVDGCRTPFSRSGTDFTDLSSYDLGRAAVAGLLHRTHVDPEVVDMLVMGRVVSDPQTTNVAREVVFGTDLPDRCVAHTVTQACISSLQAMIDVVRAIQTGAVDVGIAAGTETASDLPLLFRRPMRKRLIAAQKARGLGGYLKLLRGLRPSDLLPQAVAIAERSTGETMGQNAERLAKKLGITRDQQDEFALASHQRAAEAAAAGLLHRQIVSLYPAPRFGAVSSDNGVRADTTMAKLGALRPAFDRRFGTITAGNASFLSDGGSAVLLMREARASELGCNPLARLRSVGVTGQGPYDDLLVGPALAVPRALEQAHLELEQVEVVELHEAFAAQVLAVSRLMQDGDFCRDRLRRDQPIGALDPAHLNAWGGSLSVGHPFGATGGRLVANCVHRMQHEGSRYGLLAACAGGGLAIGMVLERM